MSAALAAITQQAQARQQLRVMHACLTWDAECYVDACAACSGMRVASAAAHVPVKSTHSAGALRLQGELGKDPAVSNVPEPGPKLLQLARSTPLLSAAVVGHKGAVHVRPSQQPCKASQQQAASSTAHVLVMRRLSCWAFRAEGDCRCCRCTKTSRWARCSCYQRTRSERLMPGSALC